MKQKNVLLEITSSKDLNASSREALARKLFENEEEMSKPVMSDEIFGTLEMTRVASTGKLNS